MTRRVTVEVRVPRGCPHSARAMARRIKIDGFTVDLSSRPAKLPRSNEALRTVEGLSRAHWMVEGDADDAALDRLVRHPDVVGWWSWS